MANNSNRSARNLRNSELLKIDRDPERKEILIKITTGDSSPVCGVAARDAYINSKIENIYHYTINIGPINLTGASSDEIAKNLDSALADLWKTNRSKLRSIIGRELQDGQNSRRGKPQK